MINQEQILEFQKLIREAQTKTGITVFSELWITTPGGSKINTNNFRLDDGTTVNVELSFGLIEGWQPPPPVPDVNELLNEARAEIAELKAQVESLLNPEPVSLIDLIESPETEFDWVALGLEDAPDFIGPNEIMNQPLTTDNGHHAD